MTAWVPCLLGVAIALALSGCSESARPFEASLSEVVLVKAPEDGWAGRFATVCWQLIGTGQTSHTDLHYGPAPIPEDHEEAAAEGHPLYPDNMPRPEPNGYRLPGEYCASVPLNETGSTYVRAFALSDGAGFVVSSPMHRIRAW